LETLPAWKIVDAGEIGTNAGKITITLQENREPAL
jgi:hypothetical protein